MLRMAAGRVWVLMVGVGMGWGCAPSAGAADNTDGAPQGTAADAGTGQALDDGGAGDSGATPFDAGPLPEPEVTDAGLPPAPDETVSPVGDPGQWSWLEVEGSVCADGQPTGVGINRAPQDSQELLLFLQGGGACWDGATCWGVGTALYVATGYNALQFATDILRPAIVAVRRNDPFNPFRHMNMVYVPYCTGDVHVGNKVTGYPWLGGTRLTHHMGGHNLDLFLDQVAQQFPNLRRIIVAGDSAGGFGAALNMDRVQRRFPNMVVDVLDDSGQPVEPSGELWQQWQAAWGVQFPPGCTQCSQGVRHVVRHLRDTWPESRFALISYTHDSVISTFMGLTPWDFNAQLEDALEEMEDTWPNARYFLMAGALHVGLATPTPRMLQWLDDVVARDPGWVNRRPFQ